MYRYVLIFYYRRYVTYTVCRWCCREIDFDNSGVEVEDIFVDLDDCQNILTVYAVRIRENQCCGSRRFLTGSGSDYSKRPDPVPYPDPDLNKFLANFFVEIFLMKICSRKYTGTHGPKS
jgi:hypothetical protein